MAGLATVAGVTGAVARTVPAAHRGAARQAGSAAHRRAAPQAGAAARHQTAGFSNWPMFRDGPAHLGVSPETAIGTATASTLTAGWTATVGTSFCGPGPVIAGAS